MRRLLDACGKSRFTPRLAAAKKARDGAGKAIDHRLQTIWPGQHRAFARVGGFTAPAGKVMQAAPGRNAIVFSAVFIAADVIEIPMQARCGIAVLQQPGLDVRGIELGPCRILRRQRQRNGEQLAPVGAARRLERFDILEEALVLRRLVRRKPRCRHDAFLPFALDQQPLIGCMQQHAFVETRPLAHGIGFDHAEVGQHLTHMGRLHRRQRQVVRTARIVQVAEAAAIGIAAEFGSVDHQEIAMSRLGQAPGATQARRAAAQYHDIGFNRSRRRRQGSLVAQQMAFAHARVSDLRRQLAHGKQLAPQPHAGTARGSGQSRAEQEAAARDHRITFCQSSSK